MFWFRDSVQNHPGTQSNVQKTQLKDASEHMSCRWDICLIFQILDKFIIHVCIFEHLWHRGPDALARRRREIHRTQEIIHIFPPAVQYMPHLNCTQNTFTSRSLFQGNEKPCLICGDIKLRGVRPQTIDFKGSFFSNCGVLF